VKQPIASAEAAVRHEQWHPPGARYLDAVLQGLDRAFDAIYSSRYNPLRRTGTVAALCLAIACVTGVYLLFVYDIAHPYESIVAIQRDVGLGRWMRALHRYASDVALVAVALHVVRLLVQGKTWGPRALAWVTGVLLAGMMFASALTGFVLVWDRFGQMLAVAGARMLRVVPLFPEPPDRAFVGDRPLPSQFFFMNLFLHVAVPLGMVAFLWLHTARLARAAWFPERKVALGTLLALLALSVAWPAPLPPAADLLVIPGRVAVDWFYGFWLPLAQPSPAVALGVAVLATALMLAAPWVIRPRVRGRPLPAFADPEKCEGCEQCLRDCPYDAIRMVAGRHPERHPLLADVQPSLCVSCGVCAGSCASLAIGPPSRTAGHQLASARELVARCADRPSATLVIACASNGGVAGRLHARFGAARSVAFFGVGCAGVLHPATTSYLASRFARTVVVACPTQGCLHREGAALADARLLLDRPPAVPGRLARLPLRVVHGAMGEWADIVGAVENASHASTRTPLRAAAAVVVTAVLLGSIAMASRAPQGVDAEHAALRLGWRLAGQVRERCRDLTADELARRPAHMRQARDCTREALPYVLTAVVDGAAVRRTTVRPPGLRSDRPLSVEEDLVITPGDHTVLVTFAPADAGADGKVLRFERTVRFRPARVVLISYDGEKLIAQ
jgi:ferredoxin